MGVRFGPKRGNRVSKLTEHGRSHYPIYAGLVVEDTPIRAATVRLVRRD